MKGFIQFGYKVMLGSRSPDKLKQWQSEAGAGSSIGTFEEAARFGNLLVLDVKGDSAHTVLDMANAANLKDKLILETTNTIAPEPPIDGVLKFTTSLRHSLMESLQDLFPQASFVKAFSSVGNARMVNISLLKENLPCLFVAMTMEQKKKLHGYYTNLVGK